MGDWDFLHEMRDRGYSQEAITGAMACGYAPWEGEEIAKQERKAKWEELKSQRDSGEISPEEFKKRKTELFK